MTDTVLPTRQSDGTSAPRRAVTWFGESHRKIGGEPDSLYGWLVLPEGGVAIIKAMDPDLVAYNKTLLDHERRMLTRLGELGAPTPELLDLGRDDWLATRFAGLSLHRLAHAGGLQGVLPQQRLPLAERLALWIHTLRRTEPLAQQGVLVVDLYDANVVAPLTQGLSGQLRLNQPVLIDHGFTLEAGMNLRRPVWLDREMDRIPPELREALKHDQEALQTHFAQVGAALPGYSLSRMAGERDRHSRQVWAEYDAPQALQQLLDNGRLSCDHAMQFAAAKSMERLLVLFPGFAGRQALARVLATMTMATPSQRYPTLGAAADALEAVLGHVPLASEHHYQQVVPEDLSAPTAPAAATPGAAARSHTPAPPLPVSTGRGATLDPPASPGTGYAGDWAREPAWQPPTPPTQGHGHGNATWWQHPAWPLWLAAAGAALGAVLPLPW